MLEVIVEESREQGVWVSCTIVSLGFTDRLLGSQSIHRMTVYGPLLGLQAGFSLAVRHDCTRISGLYVLDRIANLRQCRIWVVSGYQAMINFAA